jgi:hypothetical protein
MIGRDFVKPNSDIPVPPPVASPVVVSESSLGLVLGEGRDEGERVEIGPNGSIRGLRGWCACACGGALALKSCWTAERAGGGGGRV